MIEDRIILLEKELEKAKSIAADLYYEVAVLGKTVMTESYHDACDDVLRLEQDLKFARLWKEKQNIATTNFAHDIFIRRSEV